MDWDGWMESVHFSEIGHSQSKTRLSCEQCQVHIRRDADWFSCRWYTLGRSGSLRDSISIIFAWWIDGHRTIADTKRNETKSPIGIEENLGRFSASFSKRTRLLSLIELKRSFSWLHAMRDGCVPSTNKKMRSIAWFAVFLPFGIGHIRIAFYVSGHMTHRVCVSGFFLFTTDLRCGGSAATISSSSSFLPSCSPCWALGRANFTRWINEVRLHGERVF